MQESHVPKLIPSLGRLRPPSDSVPLDRAVQVRLSCVCGASGPYATLGMPATWGK